MSELEPRVSVIITAFRRAEIVTEAIRCALDQTYPPYEVVVVDDASGDATPAAVRGVADQRVKLVPLTENRGQSGAINAGIEAASGDIVAMLDSDDLWTPEKLELQIAAWRDRDDRDQVLFSSRALIEVDGIIRAQRPERLIRDTDDIDHYLFVQNGLLQTSTLLMSRSLARSIMFDGATRRHGDLAFLLRLAHHGGKVCQLPAALTHWRSSAETARISTTPNLESSLQWLEKYRPLMSRRAAIAFRYRNHIRILRKHNKRAAVALTLKAIGAGVLGWRDVRRKLASTLRKTPMQG